MDSRIRLISCDPGSANFSVSVLEGYMDRADLRVNVLRCFMFDKTLRELKADLNDQRDLFKHGFKKLFKQYEPSHFIAERFQPRGFGGNTIENVNVMLGMLLMLSKKAEYQFITASTWKNAANRVFDLDVLYDYAKQYKVTAHQVDSTLIGIYKLGQLTKTEPFSVVTRHGTKKFAKYLANKIRLQNCKE